MSSIISRSKFEDLSDDILMDIFDLLCPPVYIYHSFFNLNQRLNRIINDSRLLISLDLSHLINPLNFAYHCQIMLPNMSKQLISLRLSNEQNLYEQIKIFLLHLRLGNFHALRQLSLIQITFDQLRRMLADILSLNKLVRLHIDMFDGSGISSNELNLIANTLINKSNSIKFLHLRFNREFVISEIASSSLTHLTLDACASSDIPQLLSLCSNLTSLTIKVEQSRRRYPLFNITNCDQQLPRHNLSSVICSSLTYFSIDINDLTLSDIKYFLSSMPYLDYFRIEGLTYDIDFSKGDLWEKIFENQTKKLKQFDMTGLRIWLGNNADDDDENLNLINQINHSFGSSHKYWGKYWSVYQAHKLRPNHVNLTLHAKNL
ncbi:unnamed protein product [Adineta steineri]|uniref:F-box domain-containing protein n=1 Tax=Adineta steineri TaxID=433720 RepID=A0A819K2B8_9BILA|nr:unnamed protein product [Adineta steineri]CAF1346355.1 unnamed protein product [Adineta steineri]CAF1349206.1 unnamed protein product [Adineta steineri]CAF3571753.1 unnamed protein product [Adineta steineri]CAF3862978.1 unnamed protein product [Adineta steineri]